MSDASNTISGAQTLTLEQIYKDKIATDSDIDYFKIAPVSTPSQVTINFTGLTTTVNNNEFSISIVDGSSNIVASTTKGLSTSLKASLAKDTPYYLKIAKANNGSQEEYSIKASIIATAEPAGEKNSNDNISTTINNATVLDIKSDIQTIL